MSVDFNVYVGPYLDIREPVTHSIVDQCAEHERGDADYCPRCGASREGRRSKRTGGVLDDGFWGHADWIDRLQNATSSSYEINISGDVRTVRAIWNRSGFGVSIDRGHDTAAHAIPTAEGFEEALWPEIRRIRELGCTVEVKLGVLVWYS